MLVVLVMIVVMFSLGVIVWIAVSSSSTGRAAGVVGKRAAKVGPATARSTSTSTASLASGSATAAARAGLCGGAHERRVVREGRVVMEV